MIVVIVVAALLATLCLFLSIRGVFSKGHSVIHFTLSWSPARCLLASVLVTILVGAFVLCFLASGAPGLRIVALVVAALWIILVLFGLSMVAGTLGDRVLALRNRDSSPFAKTVVGTVFLAILGSLPFLGWFVIDPMAVSLGFGAVVMSAKRWSFGRAATS